MTGEGFAIDFLAGVWAGAGVAGMGDMGWLSFLDRLAGWCPELSGVGGTPLARSASTFIVSMNEAWIESVPKDGARLRDLEAAEAAKESARFIF